jgi:hypothetical protein
LFSQLRPRNLPALLLQHGSASMSERIGERVGILAAVLSSAIGGTAAAMTRASILAAVIIGEPVGLNLALGVIAVLGGIWIAAGGPRQEPRA